MKIFPLLLFFALTFALTVSAQTNQSSVCPAVDVTGGDKVIQPGESRTFTVKVEKFDLTKLSFKWVTSRGEIIEGQGTQTIKVSEEINGENITVTVEIDGLPSGCPNTDSDTGVICNCALPKLIDEFSISSSQIEKSRLDTLLAEVGENSNSQIYIIEYFKRGTPQKAIDRKIQKITEYLANEKLVAKDKFIILTADSRNTQNRTMFWIVPPGAIAPEP